MLREEFINAKRIVIKLGTNVLRNADGEVAISRIYSFIEDMAKSRLGLVYDNEVIFKKK